MNIQKLQSKLEKIKTELARSQARLNQLNADNQKNQDEKNNISFIMPAYNCADTIEESVDSIFNGNFTDGDELIIVNDGSTDNTEKVLEKLRRNYPSIKVLNHPQNRGGASARNTAVRNATHSIIFCLDSDNILVPGSVSKLKSFMLASGADVAVFKELHFFISEKQNVIHKWVYKDLITLDVFFTGDPIPGASGNYMFTKESWVKAGGYPELAVCLDTHGFGFKQLATGAKMLTCEDLYYYHRQGIESYYVRDSKKHNLSQIMAQIITPFTYLINEEDVRYIYGEGKDTWFADLEKRPIRLREGVDVANPLSALGEALENPMLDLQELCRKHLVTPKGVIHIGAHEGAEIKRYQAMGVHKVLFIEANPVVFERLSANIASIRNVQAVNCAISNQNGMVNLRVTSMDQSSSILPLKRHQEIYPHIKETDQVTVKGRTLDTLLHEMEIQGSEYNIINLDIQGAELLALQGATDCLKYIDAINTEVNYEELYEGCALISQLDDFLWLHGFERVATVTPFHPSWGDAFYVRKSVVTMSTLGSNGRFANQIFQYAFLKIYAKEHQLKLQTSEWIGQYLFGHQEPVVSRDLPQVKDPYSEIDDLAKALNDNSITPYTNVDFWAYFQYHTSCYTPHKEYFCSLFQPVPGVKTKLQLAVQSLQAKGKTVVGLHLRRGDYGYNEFFITPNEWYKKWLQEIWGSLEQPVLFIASDEIDKVIGDFREYNPITSKDLGIELPEAPFYPDFYLLSQCDIVAISNSSFSFAACMLNKKGKLFVRPYLLQEKLIPFDPWNDYPILRESQITQHSLAEETSVPQSVLNSPLNRIIGGEITGNDGFYEAIQKIAQTEDIKTVLEIGSSSGQGSTEAFVKGLRQNPNRPLLFCMELSKTRFAELQKYYSNEPFVKCYNVSSVSLEKFPNHQQVKEFYSSTETALNNYSLSQVLDWLNLDIEYVKNAGVPTDGIKIIKQENQIENFDFVLIDGSEFTGSEELDEVYGAKFIALNDTNAFKNYKSRQRLLGDSNYTLIADNQSLRNGYSIFKKVYSNTISQDLALPINFFTIVLNGEPFIRYHIEVFKQLPFKWHWHIVEGVAELKHDTAWSLSLGGKVTDEIHRNGRSNDGTTEYLDKLKQEYPDNITIYRKPKGIFWDGKREMVNAPLDNINQECLLWQVDVDELWTQEQICTTRQMFIDNPTKTAAWYWCWYFVGENLVIITRNCYAQNPQQEWLRTWRFKPGMNWQKHEPPCLGQLGGDGEWYDVAAVNPFRHEETEKQGLVFQHFAYVMNKQLQFKETYYGYKDAVLQWSKLQKQTQLPVLLREYVGWVHDETMVNTATSMGLLPILSKAADGINWRFKIGSQEVLAKDSERIAISEPRKVQIKDSIKVIVDGVFFQLNHTGIARVWNSLLEEWVISGFAKQVLVIDRAGSAPKINGVQYRTVEAYNYGATDADRQILQQICDEEGADIFISTYYTTPISTPSVFMGYDMIPELIGKNLDNEPMWIEKHYGIKHASAYITISKNTAYNLAGCFPHISPSNITVAHCGVKTNLFPANSQEISAFRSQYGIYKPYFLLVGERSGWCGYKNGILFFKAFAQLANKHDFEIVCTGGVPTIEEDFLQYTSGVQVHKLYLTDEELRVAYSGAVVLVYPSLYEGFGMPVIEAMACGCPVIASKRASIPEVAGTAALYISGFDVSELVNALQEVQKPELRNQLISAGLEQAKKFSWSKMAKIVREALLQATNKYSNDTAIIANKPIQKLASTFNIRSGKSLPKISIVTPSFNQGEYLEECIDSVLSQGYPNLEYVIMDGGSTDGSVETIKKYEKYLNYWQSKPDGGQYASINQGFAKTNGEIMAWINSDDKYHHDAFFKVAAAFNKYPQMEWLMGRPNAWDGLNGNAQWIAEYEPQWSREFLLGKTWKSCGQWIQQESTFWKRSLWNKAGGQLQLEPPMVTADFELWVRFSRHAQLYFMDTLLGGARWHEKQRSRVFWDRCMEEIDEVLAKEQALIASGLHQTSLPAPHRVVLSAEEIVALKQQTKQIIQVSVIVSTYNSAKFIRGCLETLVNQTLYQKGELEIVVIDSASPQNEESIVKEFQAKYPNIIYERTSQRETLYASWNRAIKMARGVYITNANTDDRLRPDALEFMANYLDNHPDVSLAYPDQLITNTVNDTWEKTNGNRRWNWPSFNYNELESRCIIGSQPMWRKSLHEKYGYFRPEFTSAGDYEFWLRIGKTEKLARIPEPLGLYYENPQGLEHSSSVGQQETQKILEEYGITQRGVIPKTSIPVPISPSELNALPYRQIGQSTVNIGRPLVSVIIPTKDRPEMLAQAIQSVLNQTFTELEIIVVNDGGVDVQSVISRLNTRGNIVYKKHEHTLERSAARNTGIRVARGKYIAYLDDDDNYYPNHIETLVKFLENSEYKIAYTDAVMAEQEKQNGEYVTINRSVHYSLDFDKDKILVSNCTPNLCLMHEKSCLDEVGLFDETLSTHEDWDLIIRLSRKFDIAHIKETTCEFTQRNDGTNTSSHNRADFTRTREIIFNRYRHYAEANPTILEAQKEAFIAEAKELAQQVQNLQSQVVQKESQLQQTQAEKSQLSVQVESWQRTTQEVQAKLEATQSEKEWVKSQLNSWKQTAEEIQLELDRSRSKLKQAQSQLDRSALNLIK